MDPLKLTTVGNTRYSITLTWSGFKEPGVSYRLQLRDRLQGWITKYWGFKTQVEVGGLSPEECYHFRVGVISFEDKHPPVWSKIISANTKDDLILIANLHRLVQYGNVNAVRKLISSRPHALDSFNHLGQPTLSSAANPNITALLLNSGANYDLPSRFTSRTALMQAAALGQVEVAILLLEKGASWQLQDRVGCTAVHYAVDNSQSNIVELAVSSGANLDLADSCGWTPLLRGVVLGSKVKVLRQLLTAGADVNHRDCHGQNSLLLAVLSHHMSVVELLLSAGATVLDPHHIIAIATAQGDVEIETLLRSHFDIPKNEGRSTPAHLFQIPHESGT